MTSIYLLIPLSLLLLAVGAWAFFWAVNNDQFENLDESGKSIFNGERPDIPPDDIEQTR
ncbi:MAG: cbb3-type cytochrome oxidase assembly protein CcoS [Gammaproteobacteria bacterium]|jgi:cbb3-type cytochrome oxidase maturation protein|nr:cbb3-type cytochrome oxidase assembly protein CcoS [Gammaproteobacteria bacterium]